MGSLFVAYSMECNRLPSCVGWEQAGYLHFHTSLHKLNCWLASCGDKDVAMHTHNLLSAPSPTCPAAHLQYRTVLQTLQARSASEYCPQASHTYFSWAGCCICCAAWLAPSCLESRSAAPPRRRK